MARPATRPERRAIHARRALELLKDARDEASRAGAERTVSRIRLAITSAGGAIRHAEGISARASPAPPDEPPGFDLTFDESRALIWNTADQADVATRLAGIAIEERCDFVVTPKAGRYMVRVRFDDGRSAWLASAAATAAPAS